MDIIGKYVNGNYNVTIYADGTKIRENDLDSLIPAFAENCDVTITECCDGGCEFCYMGCTPNGRHADLLNQKWVDTLHPYTELALNGNDLTHPQLIPFLEKLREKKVIANLTVNQKHFMKNIGFLHRLIDDRLIYGLGVSLVDANKEFIAALNEFPNVVIHTIAGILSAKDIIKLSNNNIKLLILGYKEKNRGINYFENHSQEVEDNILKLSKMLPQMINLFNVISFDNLALEQLDVKNALNISDEKWSEIYMGDDGNFTFFIDMVNQTFARNSVSKKSYPIMNSVDDMFNIVKLEKIVDWQDDIKRMREHGCTDSDIEDYMNSNNIDGIFTKYIWNYIAELSAPAECEGCKHIQMQGMYPCNNCIRQNKLKDYFEVNIDGR